MKKRIKINGIIMFCAFLLVVFFPGIFFRKSQIGFSSAITGVFGIAFILLGQIFRVSARGYKSEQSDNGHSLVEGGPYTLVRNPMYLGIILISVGVILALFQWWVVCVFLLFFIVRYHKLILKEEGELLKIFPDDYAAYLKHVPRLMPSWKALFLRHIEDYLPLKPAWIKKEISSMLAVLLLVLALKLCMGIRYQGVAVYLQEVKYMLVVILLFLLMMVYLCKRTKVSSKNAADKSQDN
ncbi:MAG: isoprenylcysteine carboxylmethyltransferase family protein [Candidatus Omnitrophica bacterium]|nr:isoprenylcysteine carboxylmethyltransferase family protein [Candidatus Omnitrophota bacterium]